MRVKLYKGDPMLKSILPLILLVVFVGGCAGPRPVVKDAADKPEIKERDITDNKRDETLSAPNVDDKSQAHQEISPQTGPLETPAPAEPVQQRPRTYKFDRATGKGRPAGAE
jgi:hypothetical protein